VDESVCGGTVMLCDNDVDGRESDAAFLEFIKENNEENELIKSEMKTSGIDYSQPQYSLINNSNLIENEQVDLSLKEKDILINSKSIDVSCKLLDNLRNSEISITSRKEEIVLSTNNNVLNTQKYIYNMENDSKIKDKLVIAKHKNIM